MYNKPARVDHVSADNAFFIYMAQASRIPKAATPMDIPIARLCAWWAPSSISWAVRLPGTTASTGTTRLVNHPWLERGLKYGKV